MKSNRSKGITLSYLYFVLNTIISIFMSAFVIRSVGQTNYGVYQSMTAFISYLVLLEFGTGTIMTRNISLCKKDGSDDLKIKKNVSTIWSLTIVLSLLILLVSLVFWFSLDTVYSNSMTSEQIALGKELFVFAVGNLLFSFLRQTLNGLLIGFECYSLDKSISIIKLLSRTVILVILLSVNNSVFIVVIVDFLLSLAAFLITLIYCVIKLHAKLVFRYFDRGVFKLITPLAFAMLLQTIVNTANGNVDKFLISIMMTPEDVSVYSVAMSMFMMFSSVASLPVTMFMPAIAKNMQNNLKGKELTKTLVQPCRLNILITGVIAFGFLCVGQQFINIIYGEDYTNSWLCAIIVILPTFVNMTNAVIINVIDILRKRPIYSCILLITTVLNIALTVISIIYIGMVGAAAATGLTLIIQTIILNIYYKKKIGISVFYLYLKSYKGILPCLLFASVISILIIYLLDNILLQFFIGGIVFVISFFVPYYLFGMNDYEKNILKKY